MANLLPLHASMLEFQLQSMAAFFAAPGWRTDNWERQLAALSDADVAALADPQRLYTLHAPAVLARTQVLRENLADKVARSRRRGRTGFRIPPLIIT